MSDADPRPTYRNPVIDSDFPDPFVLAANGAFYAYSTQTMRDGCWINVPVARSTDLVSWNQIGDAMPEKPSWANSTQAFLAPDVMSGEDGFFLYFAACPDWTHGMAIGVATSDSPDGPFTATEEPLLCGKGYRDIDPLPFDDPATGKHYLYWGSGFEPIRVQELAADRIHFAPGSQPVELIAPRKPPAMDGYENLIEAASVIFRDGYYYLFYSGDNCCRGDPHYAVMIARSRSPTGPFERMPGPDGRDGNFLLRADDRWDAPGHSCVLCDANGEDWVFYHAIDRKDPRMSVGPRKEWRRPMLMDRLLWEDDWPRVAGEHPSQGRRPAPALHFMRSEAPAPA